MTGASVAAELGIPLDAADRGFLDELQSWLDEHLPTARPPRDRAGRIAWMRAWEAEAAAGRWVAIHWPEEYGGRAATALQQLLYHVELNRRRAPKLIGYTGLNLCGPTLIAHGTP